HIRRKYCRAGVCSDLFISPCENTCPAHINIPGYLALIAAGRFLDAYDLICQENPLPSVCGRICTRPCESKCRRATVDEAISICSLKRFVADYAYKNQKQFEQDIVFPRNGKSVAVIGAGASGLTCAYYLSRIGYEVDVFEREPVAGGVLAYGIPEYRLPSEVLEREIDHMRRSGFTIRLNTEVGRDITFDRLRREYDAVYVATGTQLPQRMNIPGEELEGVLPGIEFLKNVKLYHSVDLTGQTVAVIGGGNTAIDSARTAVRLGAAKVLLLYRRTRDAMPAYDIEVEEALEEGVELIELVSPVRILPDEKGRAAQLECVRRQMSNFDNRGRRNTTHIEGSNFFIDVDAVIPAVSQYADLPFIKKTDIGVTPWGTFITDPETMMTTMEGVFAGGDVARGPDEVIRAIADGKQAAVSIDLFCSGAGKLNKGRVIDIPESVDDDEVLIHNRFPQDYLPVESRTKDFDEVLLGYHKLNAIAESMRCLHCDRR
ncbi:MAG: FAD-dependent oxidoreductase, partial [Eubacteriales bacterium]|nr:FAD-dependent oxidoreductase [Eubacteriales bacterium]